MQRTRDGRGAGKRGHEERDGGHEGASSTPPARSRARMVSEAGEARGEEGEARGGKRRSPSPDRDTGGSSPGRGSPGSLHAAVGNQAVQQAARDLRVEPPGSAAEAEAERVSKTSGSGDAAVADRRGSGVGITERPTGRLFRRAATGTDADDSVADSVASGIDDQRGDGEPLPAAVRTTFESRFDRDFGDVTVHRDAASNELTESLDAAAFTSGTDVFFGPGRFDPETDAGRELIAHELTHVVQQREAGRDGADGPPIQRQEAGGSGGDGSSSPRQESPDTPASTARDAALESLRAAGLEAPAGADLSDYVKVETSRDSRGNWDTTVNVYVGPDGNPVPAYRYDSTEMGKAQVEMGPEATARDVIAARGERVPPSKRVEFEIFEYPDGTYDVMTRVVDMETARADEAAYSEGTRRGGPNLEGVIAKGIQDIEFEFDRPIPERERPEPSDPETTGKSDDGDDGKDTDGDKDEGRDTGGRKDEGKDRGSGEGADQPGTPPAGPESAGGVTRHRVSRGETLWAIAEQYYGDGRKWPVIYRKNKDRLRQLEANAGREEPDPDLIVPDMKLLIPPGEQAASFDRSGFTPPSSYGVGEGPF